MEKPEMTTAMHPTIAAALAPFAPQQSSIHSSVSQHVNDDDLYAIDVRSGLILQNLGRTRAPHLVNPGEALMTGLQAKLAGLVAGVQ